MHKLFIFLYVRDDMLNQCIRILEKIQEFQKVMDGNAQVLNKEVRFRWGQNLFMDAYVFAAVIVQSRQELGAYIGVELDAFHVLVIMRHCIVRASNKIQALEGRLRLGTWT